MKCLYLVKDVSEFVEDVSSYCYVVRAESEEEAVKIAKDNMNEVLRKWKWQAEPACNEEVWE